MTIMLQFKVGFCVKPIRQFYFHFCCLHVRILWYWLWVRIRKIKDSSDLKYVKCKSDINHYTCKLRKNTISLSANKLLTYQPVWLLLLLFHCGFTGVIKWHRFKIRLKNDTIHQKYDVFKNIIVKALEHFQKAFWNDLSEFASSWV